MFKYLFSVTVGSLYFLSLSSARVLPDRRTPSVVHKVTNNTLYKNNILQNPPFANSLHRRNHTDAIPVHFHVMHSGETLEQGKVPESMIIEQVKVLNDRLNQHGFSFELASPVNHVNQPDHFEFAFDQENVPDFNILRAMGKAHKKGGAKDWNIYTVRGTDDFDAVSFPPDKVGEDTWLDGSFITFRALPGGGSELFGQGMSLIREFAMRSRLDDVRGGEKDDCDGPGDYISDTPAVARTIVSCEEEIDTCPGQPGKDPIHNYMTMAPDECRKEFTPEQVAWIHHHLKRVWS